MLQAFTFESAEAAREGIEALLRGALTPQGSDKVCCGAHRTARSQVQLHVRLSSAAASRCAQQTTESAQRLGLA